MEYEWDDFEDKHDTLNIIENKSFIEKKISEKEIKGKNAKKMLRVFEIK